VGPQGPVGNVRSVVVLSFAVEVSRRVSLLLGRTLADTSGHGLIADAPSTTFLAELLCRTHPNRVVENSVLQLATGNIPGRCLGSLHDERTIPTACGSAIFQTRGNGTRLCSTMTPSWEKEITSGTPIRGWAKYRRSTRHGTPERPRWAILRREL